MYDNYYTYRTTGTKHNLTVGWQVENFRCVPKFLGAREYEWLSPHVYHTRENKSYNNRQTTTYNYTDIHRSRLWHSQTIRQETAVCLRNKLRQQSGHFFSSSMGTGSARWQFRCYKTVTLLWYQIIIMIDSRQECIDSYNEVLNI
jgi:hypothetical protein